MKNDHEDIFSFKSARFQILFASNIHEVATYTRRYLTVTILANQHLTRFILLRKDCKWMSNTANHLEGG